MEKDAVINLGIKTLGAYANWSNTRRQAKAEVDVMRQQASNAIKSMNYAFMNYEEERRDSFEQSIALIQKNTFNTRIINSGVRASIGEEQADSRTGQALVRASNGEGLRSKSIIQDNYRRKSNEIDLNKEQKLIDTQTYIAGLHPPKMPSKFSFFVDLIPTLVKDYTLNEEIASTRYQTLGEYRNQYTGHLRGGIPLDNHGIFQGYQSRPQSLTKENIGKGVLTQNVPEYNPNNTL